MRRGENGAAALRRLLMAGEILQDFDLTLGEVADRGHVLEVEAAVQELHGVLHGDLVVVLALQLVELLLERSEERRVGKECRL